MFLDAINDDPEPRFNQKSDYIPFDIMSNDEDSGRPLVKYQEGPAEKQPEIPNFDNPKDEVFLMARAGSCASDSFQL